MLLVVLTVLYNVRTRALHRHPPYLEMWEWLWWTGLITFSLLIIESLFVFDFFLVLTTEIIGIGTMVWIRFLRFPPFFAAYETRLATRALLLRQKFADPDATIKKRAGGRRQGAAAPPALAAGAGGRRAHRDPPVRRRPPAPGRADRVGRADRPGHRLGRPRHDHRARLRAQRPDRAAREPEYDLVHRRSRAAAGSASATSGRGSRPARRRSGRPTSRTRPGPSTPRCARSSSSSRARTTRRSSLVGRARGRRRDGGPAERGVGRLAPRDRPTRRAATRPRASPPEAAPPAAPGASCARGSPRAG